MKKYFIIIPILVLVYFLSGKDNSSIKTENKRIETDNLIVNMTNYGMENILLSEYLNGVVACEMPALFHDEAISMDLNKLKVQMGSNFMYTHKSYLVNIKRVYTFNWKDFSVIFDNGRVENILSRTHKKELMSI